jgi:hypothetical protein
VYERRIALFCTREEVSLKFVRELFAVEVPEPEFAIES